MAWLLDTNAWIQILAAWHYAGIRHQLEGAGHVIGPNDLKIAAICRANGLTLVTSNTAEFSRVPNLQVEDWSNQHQQPTERRDGGPTGPHS